MAVTIEDLDPVVGIIKVRKAEFEQLTRAELRERRVCRSYSCD
jgi:hypothetical protein